jgi:hypothetical protein
LILDHRRRYRSDLLERCYISEPTAARLLDALGVAGCLVRAIGPAQ